MIKRTDPEWHGTRDYLLGEIAKAHVQLERADLDDAHHAVTRGMILAYRSIIREVEPVMIPLAEGISYFREHENTR